MSEVSHVSLAPELVKMVEAGINKHLKHSFIYSPFRVAFNLFKKSNPNTMQQVRNYVAQDVAKLLLEVPGYSEEDFIYEGGFSKQGQELRKLCYNVGIRLMKNKLNVRLAFKALRNNDIRQEIYNYVLDNIAKSVTKIINSEPEKLE